MDSINHSIEEVQAKLLSYNGCHISLYDFSRSHEMVAFRICREGVEDFFIVNFCHAINMKLHEKIENPSFKVVEIEDMGNMLQLTDGTYSVIFKDCAFEQGFKGW